MSKKKRGGGANTIYNTHLFGADGRYLPNTAQNAEFMIQRMLERNITELAMNRFEWSGFDGTGIDERFLEMCLFYNGICIVYFDHDYDKLLAVKGTGTGYVNMLDNPVSFTVIGPGSVSKPLDDTAPAQFKNKMLPAYQEVAHRDLPVEVKRTKAIPIYANYLRYPDIDTVRIYSKRLAILDRTIEINSKNARRNKVIKGSPNMNLSMVNVARSLDMGDELLQVTGPLQDMDFIEAIDLGILPESYEKLHILRTRVWNEAMNLLGIESANQDKKERLVAAEVTANDEQTLAMKAVNLKARQQACNLINSVFGTNIDVCYSTDDMKHKDEERSIKLESRVNGKEGSNGNVHDESE